MYVFSRRAIQRMLDGLADVATSHQLDNWVARLNRSGDDRLPAVWEVAVSYALRQVGSVKHEHPLPNGSTPDILFTFPGDDKPGLVMDVACVSDRGLHNRNPVDHFDSELVRLATKMGIDPNKLRFQITWRRGSERRTDAGIVALPSNKFAVTQLLMQQV